MDWSSIEAKWHEYRTRAKRQWDKLSEEQIRNTRGNREYLVKRVQESYGLSRSEAEGQVSDWQAQQVELRPAANS
jgi:uncharacterized protein YjbJ (UPF0337 family)